VIQEVRVRMRRTLGGEPCRPSGLVGLAAGLIVALAAGSAAATTIALCPNPDRTAVLSVPARRGSELAGAIAQFARQAGAEHHDISADGSPAHAIIGPNAAWSMLVTWRAGEDQASVTFEGLGPCSRALSASERRTWSDFLQFAKKRGFRWRAGRF